MRIFGVELDEMLLGELDDEKRKAVVKLVKDKVLESYRNGVEAGRGKRKKFPK